MIRPLLLALLLALAACNAPLSHCQDPDEGIGGTGAPCADLPPEE